MFPGNQIGRLVVVFACLFGFFKIVSRDFVMHQAYEDQKDVVQPFLLTVRVGGQAERGKGQMCVPCNSYILKAVVCIRSYNSSSPFSLICSPLTFVHLQPHLVRRESLVY